MKKAILSLAIISLLVSSIPALAANEQIKVYIDGRQIYFEAQPFIENDVTLVQFRPIFENLGLNIEWDEKTRTVTGRRSDLIVKLVIDDTSAIVNDERRELVIAPRIVDGNTMVPLRFVSEASGKKVNWDGNTREIWVGERGVSSTVTGDVYGTSPVIEEIKIDKPIDTPTPTGVEDRLFNLSDEQISEAISNGKQNFANVDKFSDNYNLKITNDKMKIWQPQVRFLTPYLNVVRASYIRSSKFETYSVTDARKLIAGIDGVPFNLVIYGDRISFNQTVEVVLKQGDKIFTPNEKKWQEQLAKRSSNWPDSPAYELSFVAFFNKDDINFDEKTELIYMYAGREYSITYDVDFSKFK